MRPRSRPVRIGLRARLVAAFAATATAVGAIAFPAAAALPLPTTSGGAFSVGVTSWRDMPFRRVVRQQFDYSCGSAALATLLRYHYGREVSEAQIFKAMYDVGDQAKIRKVGFSLLDMKRYLASQGLPADGYRVTLDEMVQLGVPGIALVTTGAYKHFVVVKGVAGGKVLVGDPAMGAKTFTRAEFEKMWTGGIFFAINQPGRGSFNDMAEWRYHLGPFKDPYLAEQSSAQMMLRELPTLYQITPVMNLN
jgi:predicted double-glycine peptidase